VANDSYVNSLHSVEELKDSIWR